MNIDEFDKIEFIISILSMDPNPAKVNATRAEGRPLEGTKTTGTSTLIRNRGFVFFSSSFDSHRIGRTLSSPPLVMVL